MSGRPPKKRWPKALRRQRIKTAKERKYWVHPIPRERFSLGIFQNIITELRSDEIKFFNYFRMSVTTFNDLLTRISVSINYQNTRFRDCICTEERLSIFLRYCASGCYFKELHYSYRVGVSTISKICKGISFTIWDVLRDELMKHTSTPVTMPANVGNHRQNPEFMLILGKDGDW